MTKQSRERNALVLSSKPRVYGRLYGGKSEYENYQYAK